MDTEKVKTAAMVALVIALCVLAYMYIGALTAPTKATKVQIKESQQAIQTKGEEVQRVIIETRTQAATVTRQVERHVQALAPDAVASELNAMLEQSRMERSQDNASSAGVD